MRWLVAAVLLFALLSGCGAKSTPDAAADGLVPGVDVHSTATTGVIRGVVVDPAIRPIPGVLLKVQARDRVLTANSMSSGGFGFEGLEPGTYFVQAHKLGYGDARVAVEVRAGVDAPPVAKVGLEPNLAARPYVETYVFKGFIECGTNVVALCSAPNVAGQAVGILTCDGGVPGVPCTQPGNATNDNFAVKYFPAKAPDWIQSEMVWDSTQALGDKFRLAYSYDPLGACGLAYCDEAVAGPSPLLLAAGADKIPALMEQGTNETGFLLRVFSEGSDMLAGAAGATAQQDFTVYTHMFFGYTPPPGYRFSADGDPPAPT
ncbi:MAG: carboxypeptidase-like regulatory domain-containing protein [Thermoplasmatota archaeon]